jgi:hypothetical protein
MVGPFKKQWIDPGLGKGIRIKKGKEEAQGKSLNKLEDNKKRGRKSDLKLCLSQFT